MRPGRLARAVARCALGVARRLAEDVHGTASRTWPTSPWLRDPALRRVPAAAQLAEILRRADLGLVDNVLSFWLRHAPDDEHGGFVTHLDRAGRRVGGGDKYLVLQARLVWTLAAAHRHGLVDRGYLSLAERGARFLVERMWDSGAGGFVWATRRDGGPLDRSKLTYGQAFAIYGLAEYALASGSRWALDWASRALDVLVDRAGDGDRGFRERFDGDWRPAPGLPGIGKTLWVHLHVMEALTTLVEASRRPAHAVWLRTVTGLVLSRAIDPRDGYAIDEQLDGDWNRAVNRWRPHRVSYGHAVELAWLAWRALAVLGDAPGPHQDALLGLIDHALDYGFDHRRGGVARWGPPAGAVRFAPYVPPAWRVKHWWEQAEMLPATLFAHRWTGEPRYLAAFARQFEYVWRHQMDHEDGEWFEATAWRDGRPLGSPKEHAWRDPYHVARALLETSKALSAPTGPAAGAGRAPSAAVAAGAGPELLRP